MQFSKVLYVLFPVAVLAAPLQTFKVPTLDPHTVAPEVPAIDRRIPQTEDTCDEHPLSLVFMLNLRRGAFKRRTLKSHCRYGSGSRPNQPHLNPHRGWRAGWPLQVC
ncbi:hypothetical protein CORC01_07352 [Colletotrichum orchidophilum]|uniref:Uncharacterized protein n=1 Tax=Colletotrichum orchidophilum TaxID=1209926 RepID=A0A1G4B7A9_9PEZI|nr:uncharacterized protein CORC01_07352 [Colletotrichum orchidophilum]OHE97297.1 hypothetical protein CORC01_07352 [Colletotrichum orchidophilum]